MWVRGLKQATLNSIALIYWSHPVWVRGLKPGGAGNFSRNLKSHPVWVRGLKQSLYRRKKYCQYVAPRVGAWIETHLLVGAKGIIYTSHPVWVRGLKHLVCATLTAYHQSHPVWVRGLKQS